MKDERHFARVFDGKLKAIISMAENKHGHVWSVIATKLKDLRPIVRGRINADPTKKETTNGRKRALPHHDLR